MRTGKQNGDFLKWYQWIRLIGITLAVYVAMEYVLPVVFPFCIGFVAALALYPFRKRLENRLHIKRETAAFFALFIGLCIAGIVLFGCLYLLMLGGRYAGESGLLEVARTQGREVWNTCCDRLHTLTGQWVMDPGDYSVFVAEIQNRSFRFDAEMFMNNWKDVSAQTFGILANVLIAIVSSLLMLCEFDELKQQAQLVIRRLFHAGFGLTIKNVGWTWVKAQLIIIGTITGICVLGLLLARERYWLLIGILIGICDALPFLGTGICFLPWALWRLLSGRYASALWFVALYMVTSLTRQSLEPRLIGKKIGVPPLAVLISVYVGVKVYAKWGFLLGPVSAFLIWQLYSDEVAMEDSDESDETADGEDDML